jgi:hypothetical protein
MRPQHAHHTVVSSWTCTAYWVCCTSCVPKFHHPLTHTYCVGVEITAVSVPDESISNKCCAPSAFYAAAVHKHAQTMPCAALRIHQVITEPLWCCTAAELQLARYLLHSAALLHLNTCLVSTYWLQQCCQASSQQAGACSKARDKRQQHAARAQYSMQQHVMQLRTCAGNMCHTIPCVIGSVAHTVLLVPGLLKSQSLISLYLHQYGRVRHSNRGTQVRAH